jgi:hypothetical protein
VFEYEYNLLIREEFKNIAHQINDFLHDQALSYEKLHRLITDELDSHCSSPSSDDDDEGDEIGSKLQTLSNTEHHRHKRHRSRP